MAWVSPSRMRPAEPSEQSRRVRLIISTMVRTPRPASPTGSAQASANSTSLVALDRSPILSLRCWIQKLFFDPSGFQRGRKKQVRPSGPRAVARNTSAIVPDTNHLWPVSKYAPSPSGTATVLLARTSDPPCFSVRAMPAVIPRF